MMQIIDIENWDRKEHFRFFRMAACAHYNLGADLDITGFRQKTKAQGLPFSFAVTYAVTAAMNEIEAFRYRIRGDNVVLHDMLHPAFAYTAPGQKYFKFVVAELGDSMANFVQTARAKALAQQEYFVLNDLQGRDDLIYISNLPKVSFTHLTHTMPANKDDAVLRLSWGKFYERDGRIWLPFNIQAHHAFVDGEQMGTYMETLQNRLNN